jgi:hypothetical protein
MKPSASVKPSIVLLLNKLFAIDFLRVVLALKKNALLYLQLLYRFYFDFN